MPAPVALATAAHTLLRQRSHSTSSLQFLVRCAQRAPHASRYGLGSAFEQFAENRQALVSIVAFILRDRLNTRAILPAERLHRQQSDRDLANEFVQVELVIVVNHEDVA